MILKSTLRFYYTVLNRVKSWIVYEGIFLNGL